MPTTEPIGHNRPGWFGIKHKDGWFVGDKQGALCFESHRLAQIALTIIWQRDGGQRLNFYIELIPVNPLHHT